MQRRRKRSLLTASVGMTATLAITASACGSGGPSEGALQGKSATAITSLAITAFHTQKSVTFATKTVAGSKSTLESGSTSKAAASETLVSGGTPLLQSRLVSGIAYVRAGASVLQNSLHLPADVATAHAGQWISLQKGDAAYKLVVDSLSRSSAIYQFVPEEPGLHVAGATTVAGHEAVAIVGSGLGGIAAGTKATSTLFVSTTAPYLPISSTLVVKNFSGRVIERVAAVYGKWGEPVDPIAPKGATPISSLTG
jgi:hypothetical protein